MREQRSNLVVGGLAGLAITAPVVALLYLGWQLAALPMIAFDLFERVTRLPQLGGLVTRGIDTMVSLFSRLPGVSTDIASKSAEQFSAALMFLVIGIVLGIVFAVARPRLGMRTAILFGGFIWLCSMLVEVFSHGTADIVVTAVWLAVVSAAWSYFVNLVFVSTEPATAMRPSAVEEADQSRRRFLIQLGGTAAAVTLGAWGIGTVSGRRSGSETAGKPLDAVPTQAAAPAATAESGAPSAAKAFVAAPGTRNEVTSNAEFYRVDTNVAGPPSVDEKTWKLTVDGLVNKPLSLSYDDVRKMPPTQQDATLECISNPVGGDLISSTRWTGLKLRDLLNQAGLKDGVVEIKFSCVDGYTESLPLDSAMDERTLLVYATNGEALSEAHGFPMRLYVPNRYGMKNPKWLTRVEAISELHMGYWEVRGWDKEAIVKTTSVIDSVATDRAENGIVPVGGVAFAGARGISKVEVSVDGGPWQEAMLKAPISGLTWTLWRYDWKATKGTHTLRVRAVDGKGAPQIEVDAPLHPNGASGLHSQTVTIA